MNLSQRWLFDPPRDDRPAGPPCLKCSGPTRIEPGKGPHYAKIICERDRRHWRWAPKPRPGRGVR